MRVTVQNPPNRVKALAQRLGYVGQRKDGFEFHHHLGAAQLPGSIGISEILMPSLTTSFGSIIATVLPLMTTCTATAIGCTVARFSSINVAMG